MGFNTFPCNPYPISTEELNKGNNDDLNTRVAALESDVSDLNSNKANQITIAPFFNAETAYTAGDLVYYNGLSYRCTNDHEGAWDADDFAATTIANELDSLKSGLTSVNGKVPIRGGFNIHCVQGINIFDRNTLTLVAGSIPTSPFNACLMSITNHGSNSSTVNTVETDGTDTIIINAQVEQNIYVTWLDISNIPVQQ